MEAAKLEPVVVDRDELVIAVTKLMNFCQGEMSELIAYMAMIEITNALARVHGFSYSTKEDASGSH